MHESHGHARRRSSAFHPTTDQLYFSLSLSFFFPVCLFHALSYFLFFLRSTIRLDPRAVLSASETKSGVLARDREHLRRCAGHFSRFSRVQGQTLECDMVCRIIFPYVFRYGLRFPSNPVVAALIPLRLPPRRTHDFVHNTRARTLLITANPVTLIKVHRRERKATRCLLFERHRRSLLFEIPAPRPRKRRRVANKGRSTFFTITELKPPRMET